MDKGNSSKDEDPSIKKEEKEKKNEEQAGPSNPDDGLKTMQPAESSTSLKDDESAIEAIRRYMAEKLGFTEGRKADECKKKIYLFPFDVNPKRLQQG